MSPTHLSIKAPPITSLGWNSLCSPLLSLPFSLTNPTDSYTLAPPTLPEHSSLHTEQTLFHRGTSAPPAQPPHMPAAPEVPLPVPQCLASGGQRGCGERSETASVPAASSTSRTPQHHWLPQQLHDRCYATRKSGKHNR